MSWYVLIYPDASDACYIMLYLVVFAFPMWIWSPQIRSALKVTIMDGRDMGALVPESFDGILLDAPCSCEGNIRKE